MFIQNYNFFLNIKIHQKIRNDIAEYEF